VSSIVSSNNYLKALMHSERPFLVGRLGGNECNIVFREHQESNIFKYSIRERIAAWTVAGIFPPTGHNLKNFSKIYMKALENSDCLAEWPSGLQPSVDFISNSLDSNIPRIRFAVLDIFDCAEHVAINELWIQSLENKSVLVVHPFSKSFSMQMNRIDKVHNTPILPNFKATFYAPPQSNGLKISMKSYVKNLEICMKEIDLMSKKTNFDFALIAAGGYGLPLASFLKNLGISSIYVGGALQLYFGVLGNRWTNRPNLRDFKTKNWLDHPLEEPPHGFKLVENGSYW
jgi:hypothetical protein